MSKQGAASVNADADGNKPPGIRAFYSLKESNGPSLEIWLNSDEEEGAPDFDGTFDGKRVAVYFREGKKGNYLTIRETVRGENKRYAELATAAIVTNPAGVAKLVINMPENRTFWAEVSKKLATEIQVLCGLNLEIQARKKREYAAARKKNKSVSPGEEG